MTARPKPAYPLRVVLPPATAAMLRDFPGERPEEVIRRALKLLRLADRVPGRRQAS